MKIYPYIIVKFQDPRVIEKILQASGENKMGHQKKDQESTLQAKRTWKIAFNTGS